MAGEQTGVVAITSDMLRDLIAGVAAQINPGISAESLRAILESTAASAATNMHRTLVKENPNYSEVSPFTYPEGQAVRPAPRLKRKTYFCYAQQKEETLTPTEIDAFNAITRSCSAQDGRWTATVVKDGTEEKLHVFVPNKNLDDRMGLPSLLLILRELKDGKEAVDTDRMAERVAELEAQVVSFKLAEMHQAKAARVVAR